MFSFLNNKAVVIGRVKTRLQFDFIHRVKTGLIYSQRHRCNRYYSLAKCNWTIYIIFKLIYRNTRVDFGKL